MARNGSGTMVLTNGVFSGSTTFEQDRDAGVNISASRVDYALQDICNALSTSIATDGQSTVTANIPMGGFKTTNVAAGSARTDGATIGNLQLQSGIYCGVSGGTATAITLSPTASIAAYTDGMIFSFISPLSSTGAATTVNVSGVGAVSLKVLIATGSSLTSRDPLAGELLLGNPHIIQYNTAGYFILLNPYRHNIRWTSYTPTYSAVAPMSFGSVTTVYARYRVVDTTCEVQIRCTGTTSGTASSAITASLPINLAGDVYNSAVLVQNSVISAGYVGGTSGGSTISVFPFTGTWGLSANTGFMISVTYPVAVFSP